MRCQNVFVTVIALVLSLITLTGMAYTDEFPQAAQAESVGFDALAHDLFAGAVMAANDGKPQAAEAHAQ